MPAVAGTDVVQLIVGLGNPGAGYAEDRHNAGFWFVDELARHWRTDLREDARYKGEFGRAGNGMRLLKPQTFMNLSGESVAACASYFRIPPASVLVCHDELDLDAGTVRLKRGGGHGGHNGLRSIESQLGGNAYLRLRLGIGHPGSSRDVTAHVLGRPSAEDRTAIRGAIDFAISHIDAIIGGDFDRAMNTLNRKRDKEAG